MAVSPVQRAMIRLREQGLRGFTTLALDHLEDRLFDAVHGTDTYGVIAQDRLESSGPKPKGANEYAPTRSRSIRLALKHFALPVIGTFVDMGSGKGKALLIAARYGFKRIIGIEFVPSLYEAAKRNVERMQSGLKGASIDLRCMDATEYRFTPDDTVLYFFDPFGADVMRKVLRNFKASLDESPRQVWVIYVHPVLLPLLLEELPVQEKARYGAGFQQAVLLSNR